MTANDPRCRELLRRLTECKEAMIKQGLYLKAVNLRHTNVQATWAAHGWRPPFGNTGSPPAKAEPTMCSTLVAFNAKSAKRK